MAKVLIQEDFPGEVDVRAEEMMKALGQKLGIHGTEAPEGSVFKANRETLDASTSIFRDQMDRMLSDISDVLRKN